ncbi:hypothetical protein ERX37_02795 [Macrococcus hajekii]|uniref:SAM-dependent methyltransferase n=1 Tax=Macrococcus hajekii TaxID=198482 RepID=A0A4R6BMH2_9STAP|nr:class I SAM-dependent methyltransferase [Macrococcus hajekii]TDM03029.1 hypothetical protein ERX37_02795 [Macrococcus hajekii]GGB06011.1 hypothetical protein GCM10007190_12520 [Macrococcus hajekii]
MSTVSKVRITSPVKTDDVIFSNIQRAAEQLKEIGVEVEVISRMKKTINDFFKESTIPLIVISHQLPLLYFDSTSKIVYHENTGKFKLKAFYRRGEIPPLIQMMARPLDTGLSIVDSTMGMGNDLILMATILEKSEFHAYETHPLIYFVISEGIKQFHPELSARITFHYGLADQKVLQQADYVYADPMFEETIPQQSGMEVLHDFAEQMDSTSFIRYLTDYSDIVILKAHFRSPLFQHFNFDVQPRRNTKTHFGIKKSR